jgi:ubiquinone/menaquinone biosynthesis C-methylase UbiE
MKKHQPQSNLSFRLMTMEFRFRDWLRPPVKILQAAGLKRGMQVVDFGCGPGGFSVAAAKLVGPQGRVYAFDIHPLALKAILYAAKRQKTGNLQAVFGTCLETVPEGKIDIVLLYDILHGLPDQGLILQDLSRRLKPEGILSVSDHHLKTDQIISVVSNSGLFRYSGSSHWSLQFEKMISRIGT